MSEIGTRDFYLHLAKQHAANDPDLPFMPEGLPVDLPDDHGDYGWPDAPEPDYGVNDIDRHFAWGWLALSAVTTFGSLLYLVSQVW